MRKGYNIKGVDVTESKNSTHENMPHTGASNMLGWCYAIIILRLPCVGLTFGSRENQRRYIWFAESKCNGDELGEGKRSSEPGRLVNQHLDVNGVTVDRLAKATLSGEKAGKGVPLSVVALNPVNALTAIYGWAGDLFMGSLCLQAQPSGQHN